MAGRQAHDYCDASLPERFARLKTADKVAQELREQEGYQGGAISLRGYINRNPQLKVRIEAAKAGLGYDEPVPSSERSAPEAEIIGTGPRVEADIRAIRESAERRFEAKAKRSEEKQHQKVYFSHGPVAIFLCSDTHFGAAGTDVKRAFEEQDAILACPGSYVWFLGDLTDNMIIGKLMAEQMKPGLPVWEAWQLGQHYLERFGSKLIAVTSGNHDAWTARLSGIDYSREITPKGVLYDSDEIKANIRVGRHEFRIWTRHQFRGFSIYNPSHSIERASRFDSARFDVYAQGHVHRGAMAREFNLDGERKLALLAGTYKLVDDYQRQQGFPQNDASTAVALVLHDDGSSFATANILAVQNYMRACYR